MNLYVVRISYPSTLNVLAMKGMPAYKMKLFLKKE